MKVLVQDSLEALRNWESLSQVWEHGLEAATKALDLQFEEVDLQLNPVSLVDSSGAVMTELEAGRRLYSHLSFANTLQSTDERIWVSLTLNHFWEYFQLRWPLSSKSSSTDIEKIIRNHLFCYTSRMRFRDQPISSLWWRQRYVQKTTVEIASKAEKLLFDFNSDFPVQFLGRPNISSLPPIAVALIEFMHKLFIEDGRKYDRILIRNLLKNLDLSGGFRVASSLSNEEAKELIQAEFIAASGEISDFEEE
jgi:hypothetical protein